MGAFTGRFTPPVITQEGSRPERGAASTCLIVLLTFVTTVGLTIAATAFLVALIAASLPAVVATLLAAAIAPDCVGHQIESPDGSSRIVACDHQLATSGAFFGGFVSDDHAQTRTWMQLRRERIVNQLPVMALALERNARHV